MKEVDDAEGNTVVLTQTGEYFDAIGRMVINEDGIETGLIGYVEVEEEKEVVDSYYALYTGEGGDDIEAWRDSYRVVPI